MLSKVKTVLRISTPHLNDEIQDLIDSAIDDLIMGGVDPEKARATVPLPLIERAIKTYCKAYFGYDNPEADRFRESYEMLKQHLSLSIDYMAGGGDIET